MRNVTRFRRFLVQETLQHAKDGQWNEDYVIPCALRVLDAIDQLDEYFEGLEERLSQRDELRDDDVDLVITTKPGINLVVASVESLGLEITLEELIRHYGLHRFIGAV